MGDPELRGARVVLRPLRVEDVPRLIELGSDPSVARWWPGIDADELRQKLEPDADVHGFAVVVAGEVAGLVQYHEEEDPEYRHAGIDLFLGAHAQGRGLGPEILQLLTRYLFRERGHHRITIDPARENEPAVRAYEKAGFRRVGVMREYWRDPGGVWRDGLLMELLARDLDPA